MEKALAIPEIRNYIGTFLSNKEFKSCSFVSKAWSEYFLPWLWQSFTLRHGTPGHIQQAMNKYGLLIRNLRLQVYRKVQDKGVFSNCTQVQSLRSHYGSFDNDFSEEPQAYLGDLVQLNQLTLKTFTHYQGSSTPLFKGILLSIFHCPNLERLGLRNFKLDQEMAEHLISLRRLKRLSLHCFPFLETARWSDGISFPSMEYLAIDFTGVDWELELIARCPNLTTLVLTSGDRRVLLERTIPDCRRLCVLEASYHMSAEEMAKLIGALPPMKCIQVRYDDIPEQLQYFSSLQRHYATLEHVHLASIEARTIESAQFLTILCSCPSLRSFAAYEISGSDIAEGQPWVCLQLEIFQAPIKFDFGQGAFMETQHAVYMQLSRLCRLRVLSLWRGCPRFYGPLPTLRLGEGLTMLRPLKMLQHLEVPGNVAAELRKRDIEWMVKMWPNLRTTNSSEDRRTWRFWELCKKYGISKKLFYDSSCCSFLDD